MKRLLLTIALILPFGSAVAETPYMPATEAEMDIITSLIANRECDIVLDDKIETGFYDRAVKENRFQNSEALLAFVVNRAVRYTVRLQQEKQIPMFCERIFQEYHEAGYF